MSSHDLPVPSAQYIGSEQVMRVLADHGRQRLDRLTTPRIFALAVLAGGFITTGALMSVLLAVGTRTEGLVRLLEGFGFSAGFFFVILSGAVLFTEANVVLPSVLLDKPRQSGRVLRAAQVLRFWALAWVGNLTGALLVGQAIGVAVRLSPAAHDLLGEIVARKTLAAEVGGAGAWWAVVVSGFLANWLVGMAAFFATMGRTIIGKYIPVVLAVTAFVAAGFQHSPANMGYFSLAAAFGQPPDWGTVLAWNLLPAGIGNILGGGLAVAALLGWAYARYQAAHEATPLP